jgi:hypothetical protein
MMSEFYYRRESRTQQHIECRNRRDRTTELSDRGVRQTNGPRWTDYCQVNVDFCLSTEARELSGMDSPALRARAAINAESAATSGVIPIDTK